MNNNSNFIAALVLSILILVGFHYLVEKPQLERAQQEQALQKQVEQTKPLAPAAPAETIRDRAQILSEGARIKIQTPELHGSISLKGTRIDDLTLVNYRADVNKDSSEIVLLSPAGTEAPNQAYYAEFGWLDGDEPVPNAGTVWQTNDKVLTPEKPVKLTWDNGRGLLFERTIAIDPQFMFTITDRVKNTGANTVTLYPYGLIARHGKPQTQDFYVMHEGPLGVLGGTLREFKYTDLIEDGTQAIPGEGGWLGVTDKYWLVALIPLQDEKINARFVYERSTDPNPDKGIFQTDFQGMPISLGSGAQTEKTMRLFAGAKRVSLLDAYAEKYGLPLFDRAIDFGWYYYLTKPFLYLLDILSRLLGNLGLAIIAFTIMLKILTLPLSLKSYRSMAKMKALQPELKAIQDRYKGDNQKIGLETMALYKREKVNPLSGCLPNLIQIPIFFALYKVLYVGIELRHAPLFGWVKDLSAPDPTSVLTLFGAIDFSLIPHIGIWPILMGLSMFVQQKLSPQPPDKTQAQIFLFLPILFTFMMAQIAVGLIFYWTCSNIIGIAQQWYIMHKINGKKA